MFALDILIWLCVGGKCKYSINVTLASEIQITFIEQSTTNISGEQLLSAFTEKMWNALTICKTTEYSYAFDRYLTALCIMLYEGQRHVEAQGRCHYCSHRVS